MINFIFIDLPTVQSNVNQALNSLSVRILSDNETLNEARAKPHLFVHCEIENFFEIAFRILQFHLQGVLA